MAAEQHTISVGDTLSPLVVQLVQRDSTGVLAPVNLTDKTVQFLMVDVAGTVVVAWTTTGITITDATLAIVEYDWQAADVDTAGTYYAWFRVYDGGEYDTFPAGGRKLTILIVAAA